MRFLDIVDGNARVDYDSLLNFVFSCPISSFADQVEHPFLVGAELYEGEIRKRKDAPMSASSTMAFDSSKLALEMNRSKSPPAAPAAKEGDSGITRAIYMVRKSPYSEEKSKNVITIGRASTNDVIIADYVISKQHSQIILFNKMYFIVDLNSTNGTKVNHRPVSPNVKVQVNVNSFIAFGRVAFVFTPPMVLYKGLRKKMLSA